MKNREKLGTRIKRALDIDEIIGENDVREMRGTRELTIRECRNIIHYADEEIRLALREYILIIKGNGLYCTSYSGGTIRVDGMISDLKFELRGV